MSDSQSLKSVVWSSLNYLSLCFVFDFENCVISFVVSLQNKLARFLLLETKHILSEINAFQVREMTVFITFLVRLKCQRYRCESGILQMECHLKLQQKSLFRPLSFLLCIHYSVWFSDLQTSDTEWYKHWHGSKIKLVTNVGLVHLFEKNVQLLKNSSWLKSSIRNK